MAVGLKFDDDKPRMDLLCPFAMEELSKVLTFGAKKYSKIVPIPCCNLYEELVLICSCGNSLKQHSAILNVNSKLKGYVRNVTTENIRETETDNRHATQKNPHSVAVCVKTVTTNSLKKIPSDMLNAKEPTGENGQTTIKTDCENIRKNETLLPQFEKSKNSTTENVYCNLSGYPNQMNNEFPPHKVTGVGYAEVCPEGQTSTLTTAMPPTDFAGYCAEDAIKVSDCLVTLKNLLAKHSNTCAVRSVKLNVENDKILMEVSSGAWNWSKGIKTSRLLAAALRHLFAYARGENIDPESGLNHIAHVLCCCMFIIGMPHYVGGQDDRLLKKDI